MHKQWEKWMSLGIISNKWRLYSKTAWAEHELKVAKCECEYCKLGWIFIRMEFKMVCVCEG